MNNRRLKWGYINAEIMLTSFSSFFVFIRLVELRTMLFIVKSDDPRLIQNSWIRFVLK